MTGIVAGNGPDTVINFFQARCSPIAPAFHLGTGLLGGALGTASNSASVGSTFTPVTLDCPAGTVADRLVTKFSGGWFRFVELLCREPLGGSGTGESPFLETLPLPLLRTVIPSCAAGTVAVGFEGHVTDSRIDTLRLRCK
jgi:hypothetical protein